LKQHKIRDLRQNKSSSEHKKLITRGRSSGDEHTQPIRDTKSKVAWFFLFSAVGCLGAGIVLRIDSLPAELFSQLFFEKIMSSVASRPLEYCSSSFVLRF
jgi:hypothetical protein